MQDQRYSQIKQFIEQNIDQFHQRRLQSLERLKLHALLRRKNPYLFKAKSLEIASDLVRSLLDAHLSSQEETLFGEFLEKLAIFVCGLYFNGRKSSAEGVDLEFERDGKRYFVSVKSGPNWGNSQQVKRMEENFKNVRRITKQDIVAVNGCCYGREAVENKGTYLKLCGQPFWELISGVEDMYQQIIEPLGLRAKERNQAFQEQYAHVINRFTREFMRDFCLPNGSIDWRRLVEFSSSRAAPKPKGTR